MDENVVGEISIVGNGNVNEKERNQMVFDQIADLEPKKQGRSIDKIIDCCTKLDLDRSHVDDAIKKLLDGNVIQSYAYNSNLCYKVKKIAHNETVTPLNITTSKSSFKEKFDSLKMKFIDDFESMKESFFRK